MKWVDMYLFHKWENGFTEINHLQICSEMAEKMLQKGWVQEREGSAVIPERRAEGYLYTYCMAGRPPARSTRSESFYT